MMLIPLTVFAIYTVENYGLELTMRIASFTTLVGMFVRASAGWSD